MKFKDIKLDVKQITDQGQFEGYAAAFGNEDLGGDVIMPGAFTKTISENSNRPLLWHHHIDEPIGVTKTAEDSRGLAIEGRINMDVQRGREIHSLMKQGAVKGLSIGYEPVTKDWQGTKRILRELKLHEISLVPFPMNPSARVTAVKSADDFEDVLEQIIKFENSLPRSTEMKALLERTQEKLSALQAAQAPEAATHDDDAPEILHATSDRINKLLRGEI